MNGQTGHLIGDLPVAGKLAVKYWFRRHIPLTVLAVAAVTLLRLTGGDVDETESGMDAKRNDAVLVTGASDAAFCAGIPGERCGRHGRDLLGI